MKAHEINNGMSWALRMGHQSAIVAEQDRDDKGRFSGPGGGSGGGAAGKQTEHEHSGSFESDRLTHTYNILPGGTRMTVDSKIKNPNWLEKASGDLLAVQATFDLNGDEVYLNRMDAFRSGKGYGREAMKASLSLLKTRGFKTARGYVERTNFESQNMMKKLGAKVSQEKDQGSYWSLDLGGF